MNKYLILIMLANAHCGDYPCMAYIKGKDKVCVEYYNTYEQCADVLDVFRKNEPEKTWECEP